MASGETRICLDRAAGGVCGFRIMFQLEVSERHCDEWTERQIDGTQAQLSTAEQFQASGAEQYQASVADGG